MVKTKYITGKKKKKMTRQKNSSTNIKFQDRLQQHNTFSELVQKNFIVKGRTCKHDCRAPNSVILQESFKIEDKTTYIVKGRSLINPIIYMSNIFSCRITAEKFQDSSNAKHIIFKPST